MTNLPADLTPLILHGHVLDMLRSLPENSIQCVVTSPPYWGLRAYGTEPQVWGADPNHAHEWTITQPRRQRSKADATSVIEQASIGGRNYEAQGGEGCVCGAWRGELGLEPTPEMYVEHLADVFDEVRRVLRQDGVLWLDIGDTYTTHPAGLTGEKRWAKSGLGNIDHEGHEQAGAFDKRTHKHPRRGDEHPFPTNHSGPHAAAGLPEKNLVGIPWRVAFELQRRGWWLRAECIWAKPNPMPESTRDRPTRAHEQVFLLAKSARYFYDADAVRRPLSPSTEQRAKNHYSNPTDNPNPDSKWGKNEWRSYPVIGRKFAPSTLREIEGGYNGSATKEYAGTGAQDPSAVKSRIIAGARKRAEAGIGLHANLKTVWWIPTQPYPEAHFATFPEALAETCLQAGTSQAGCCAKCGAPWSRCRAVSYEKSPVHGPGSSMAGSKGAPKTDSHLIAGRANKESIASLPRVRRVVAAPGWRPTCTCYADPCEICGRPWATLKVTRRISNMNIRVRDAKKGTLESKSGFGGRAQATEEEVDGYDDGEGYREESGVVRSPACSCGGVPCVALDPFSGSGTVLQAARSLGLRSIGIELKAEYVALARKRSTANVPSIERFA